MRWEEVLSGLESGELRAAKKVDGVWKTNIEVKKGILKAFKAGTLTEATGHNFSGFVDKNNLMPQSFNPSQNIRLVPGGSSIRKGSYISEGVIVMPPSYVNIGAFVDQGTMIDSHVLVGSCAQIGKNVHLSAGVQIGGVLGPIGNSPVIVEDDVFIGSGCILVEGVQVQKKGRSCSRGYFV